MKKSMLTLVLVGSLFSFVSANEVTTTENVENEVTTEQIETVVEAN